MSNVKDIYVEARVPFNWTGESMNDRDGAWLASLLLNPVIGVSYDYAPDGYDSNRHGGQTAMYRLVIQGMEALSTTAVQRLVRLIEENGGTVASATAYDIEAHEEVLRR